MALLYLFLYHRPSEVQEVGQVEFIVVMYSADANSPMFIDVLGKTILDVFFAIMQQ